MAVAALERIFHRHSRRWAGNQAASALGHLVQEGLDTSACIRCRSIARTLEVSDLVPVQL